MELRTHKKIAAQLATATAALNSIASIVRKHNNPEHPLNQSMLALHSNNVTGDIFALKKSLDQDYKQNATPKQVTIHGEIYL